MCCKDQKTNMSNFGMNGGNIGNVEGSPFQGSPQNCVAFVFVFTAPNFGVSAARLKDEGNKSKIAFIGAKLNFEFSYIRFIRINRLYKKQFIGLWTRDHIFKNSLRVCGKVFSREHTLCDILRYVYGFGITKL